MEKTFKILLATDYSEAVMNAERYAVQFAKDTNSILTLLHVYQTPIPHPEKPIEFSQSAEDRYKEEIKRLELHRENLFHTLDIKHGEITYECIVREGSAGKQIRKEDQESSVDFIIVGTHGVSGFRKVFFGTHAWNVIKKSSVPVLAIPKDGLYTGIKNIVFATEYREGEIPVINYLVSIAEQFKAQVTVLHVTNYVLSKQFEADMFGRFKKEVLEKVHYDKLNIKLIKSDIITKGLEKFCNENNVDWLVMSPEKPFLLEKIFLPNVSATRTMSFHTRIPLMAVPDFYNPEYRGFWKAFMKDYSMDEEF